MDKKIYHNRRTAQAAFFITFGLFLLYILFLLPTRLIGWNSVAGIFSFSHSVEATEDPLRVSDARVVLLANRQAVVTWQTNKSADAHLWFTTDPASENWNYLVQRDFYREHVIELPVLELSKRYYLRLVSRTMDGEEDGVPQMVFDSQQPQDLIISKINFSQTAKFYSGFRPQISDASLDITVTNDGDLPLEGSFFVSALMAPDINSQTDENQQDDTTYSCFAEQLIANGLDPREERIVHFAQDDWKNCDILKKGTYQIIAAADYNDDVREGDEDNNVLSQTIEVQDIDAAVTFQNVIINDITSASAHIHFELADPSHHSEVYLQYSSLENDKLNDNVTTLATIKQDDGSYDMQIDGLQAERMYGFKLLVGSTNASSGVYTFTTLYNPLAEEEQLAAMKILDPECRRIDQKAFGGHTWSELGMMMPPQDIVRYRILWSSNTWSPWYIPTHGDTDWVKRSDGSERRVWSYFDDHQFQYETCGADLNLKKVQLFVEEQKKAEAEEAKSEKNVQRPRTQVLGVETVQPTAIQPLTTEQKIWLQLLQMIRSIDVKN